MIHVLVLLYMQTNCKKMCVNLQLTGEYSMYKRRVLDSNSGITRHRTSGSTHNQSRTHHCQTWQHCQDQSLMFDATRESSASCPAQNSCLSSAQTTKGFSTAEAAHPIQKTYIYHVTLTPTVASLLMQTLYM